MRKLSLLGLMCLHFLCGAFLENRRWSLFKYQRTMCTCWTWLPMLNPLRDASLRSSSRRN
ncbi:hypothetical protein PF005_g28384 [Phytophthora fragariae]|uniref:RxLR effector protein n=2 Tax=Phytophthora TaxID=4783 RepID=A0A6A3W1Z7_9STRA|nr:hypothetical protein PF003_g24663 [Phytophthora fragariae]KAE9269383.1 hypothetical protein PR003_g31163 [Phytophthora rubi]KAE8891254.1 hypothetical protein PF003_g24662 [Phytophthora fragariae]KAE8920788.1 hypothetical protein PF009_g28923 [Phytophthora fragariae]KAE9066023.1 hypothetical protein PF010_g27969 [Phytophthora fragariae]